MEGLAGRRALVTGAAHGIGCATAQRLAAEGARVALVDVDEPALGAATAALRDAGHDVVAAPADVADERAVAGAVAAAVEAFGGLDVVVPNAAVQLVGEDDRADRLDAAVWRRTLDVNLTGAFLTAKHGIPGAAAVRWRRRRRRRLAGRRLRLAPGLTRTRRARRAWAVSSRCWPPTTPARASASTASGRGSRRRR